MSGWSVSEICPWYWFLHFFFRLNAKRLSLQLFFKQNYLGEILSKFFSSPDSAKSDYNRLKVLATWPSNKPVFQPDDGPEKQEYVGASPAQLWDLLQTDKI